MLFTGFRTHDLIASSSFWFPKQLGLWVITQLLHSKEMGRACGHRTDILAKVHQQTHDWKHLLGKRFSKRHAEPHSFTDKSTICRKQIVTSGAVKLSNFTLLSQQPNTRGCVTHLAPALCWRRAAWELHCIITWLSLSSSSGISALAGTKLLPGLPAACIFQLLKTMSWSPALKLDVAKQKEISFCPISLDQCFPFPGRTFSCYSSGVNFPLLSQNTSIQIPN